MTIIYHSAMNLLSFGFWFSYVALPMTPWIFQGLGLLNAALSVAGFMVLAIQKWSGMAKLMRQSMRRLAGLLSTMGIIGLSLCFFVWQGIPFLSMRIFWIVWLAVFAWWGWWIFKGYKQGMKAMHTANENASYEKWLPKPKGR
jgi:hypothetical protein